MVEPRLRFGILGTARIATEHVIPGMRAAANVEVAAIASRRLETAQAAAASLGIDRALGSYEELVGSQAIDAVYIPLPNHLHREWAIAAARAGKHVLCEKPLGLSAAEADEIVGVCAAEGVALMEAFMYRLHPSWLEVRRLVESGAIGEMLAVNSVFSYFNDDPTNIRNVAAFGGGALMDIGCYPINVARLLFGSEPTRVEATMRRHPDFGTDVLTSALLEFGSGQATFTVSTLAEPHQEVSVLGSEARIEADIPFNIPEDRPTTIRLVRGGEPPVAPGVETIEFAVESPYTSEAAAFAAAVLSGEPVPTPPEDAVANMKVIDAIVAAAG